MNDVLVAGSEIFQARGELAFVLWDARRRRLLAGRDRLGVKPLLWTRWRDGLALASEAKALFALGVPRQLDDEMWLHKLRVASDLSAIPLVAVGDVYMHVRSRKALHDVMTAIRTGRPLTECGRELQVNAERHLRTRARLAALYPPDLLAATQVIAARCTFKLQELRYQYPMETVLPTPTLRRSSSERSATMTPGLRQIGPASFGSVTATSP